MFSTSIFFTRSIGDGRVRPTPGPSVLAVAAEAGDDAALARRDRVERGEHQPRAATSAEDRPGEERAVGPAARTAAAAAEARAAAPRNSSSEVTCRPARSPRRRRALAARPTDRRLPPSPAGGSPPPPLGAPWSLGVGEQARGRGRPTRNDAHGTHYRERRRRKTVASARGASYVAAHGRPARSADGPARTPSAIRSRRAGGRRRDDHRRRDRPVEDGARDAGAASCATPRSPCPASTKRASR